MVLKCKYFGECGGCTLQDMSYTEQLKHKRHHAELLGFSNLEVISGKPFGYRNRMDFVVHDSGLGFHPLRRHDKIVDVQECPISNKRINTLLDEVRSFFDWKQACKHLDLVTIRAARDSTIIFHGNYDMMDFASKTSADNVLLYHDEAVSVVKGSEWMYADILGKKLRFHCTGFFQGNPLAEEMVEVASQYLPKGGHLLDLFGGVGLFGACLVDNYDTITILDVAGTDSAAMNVPKARVITDAAENLLQYDFGNPLHVIVDPPRSGMGKALAPLLSLQPESILYVSCNSEKLALELPLIQQRGYCIRKTLLVDLFPQTEHYEMIILLTKE